MKDSEIYDVWQRIDQLNKNKTLKALSKDLGISYSTLRSQRTRNILPNIDILMKFSKELNASIDYILTGENSNFSPIPPIPPRVQKIAEKLCKISDIHLLSVENLVEGLPVEEPQSKAQIV